MRKLITAFFAFLLVGYVSAQNSTFTEVYTILQTNCASAACHDAASPAGNLNLSGTETDVYNAILNTNPTNPAAVAADYKQVIPGYPERSFLMRKINNGLYPIIDPDVAEGTLMPQSQPALTNNEIDLINSWILFGAPQNGTVVDKQLIDDYYNGQGMVPLSHPAPPDTSEGMQFHLGGIFLGPLDEKEFHLKYQLQIPDTIEVTRIETFINGTSHHFILYTYDSEASANTQPEGLREVTGFTDAFISGTEFVAVWQYTDNIDLPTGTGYIWEQDIYLDQNYHIKNYTSDSIMKAEVYMNVYYEKRQPETIEMFTDLIFYPNPPAPYPFSDFLIPANSTGVKFSDSFLPVTDLYVWQITSHTHSRSVDFDVFQRNPNGTKGAQIYEGFYNTDYTFNQGYYDNEHPAARYFDPALYVPSNEGIIHEAVWDNNTNSSVTWGLTTADEMMITILQYTVKDWVQVGVEETTEKQFDFDLHPNPTTGSVNIGFNLDSKSEASIEMFDLLGKKVKTIKANHYQKGYHSITINAKALGLPPGMYTVKLTAGQKTAIKKLLVLK